MITFYTSNPAKLLSSFKAHIAAEKGKGSIDTWEEVATDEFTHSAKNWKGKAVLKATPQTDGRPRLTFTISKLTGTQEEQLMNFSYYHGHILQAFIAHLNPQFTSAEYQDKRN